jgi:hypothetical protein
MDCGARVQDGERRADDRSEDRRVDLHAGSGRVDHPVQCAAAVDVHRAGTRDQEGQVTGEAVEVFVASEVQVPGDPYPDLTGGDDRDGPRKVHVDIGSNVIARGERDTVGSSVDVERSRCRGTKGKILRVGRDGHDREPGSRVLPQNAVNDTAIVGDCGRGLDDSVAPHVAPSVSAQARPIRVHECAGVEYRIAAVGHNGVRPSGARNGVQRRDHGRVESPVGHSDCLVRLPQGLGVAGLDRPAATFKSPEEARGDERPREACTI